MSKRRIPPVYYLMGGVAFLLLRRAIRQRATRYFRGKVVLITGASRGIGREIALLLACRGAHLVLASRRADQLEELAAECRRLSLDIEVLPFPTDIGDDSQLQALVDVAVERFGGIDILISNSGIIQGGALVEADPESIRRQFEVNVIGAIRLTQIALRPMLERGRGHIVVMASAAGRHSMPYFVPYSMTKHALIGFGEGLRRELAGSGLRVLVVNPGYTDTAIVAVMKQTYRKMGLSMIPPRVVAERTLEGIALGLPEVNVGWLETIGQYASVLIPTAADLFWKIAMPPEYPRMARRQRTE